MSDLLKVLPPRPLRFHESVVEFRFGGFQESRDIYLLTVLTLSSDGLGVQV